MLSLGDDGVDDFLSSVAGVGEQDTTGEVQPHVSPGVIDVAAVGPVPDDEGLAGDGTGLITPQGLEDWYALRDRYFGYDATIWGLDLREFFLPSSYTLGLQPRL